MAQISFLHWTPPMKCPSFLSMYSDSFWALPTCPFLSSTHFYTRWFLALLSLLIGHCLDWRYINEETLYNIIKVLDGIARWMCKEVFIGGVISVLWNFQRLHQKEGAALECVIIFQIILLRCVQQLKQSRQLAYAVFITLLTTMS